MKRTILMFMGISVSHIRPTIGLIEELIAQGHEVYCYTSEKGRPFVTEAGSHALLYPHDFDKSSQEFPQKLSDYDAKIAELDEQSKQLTEKTRDTYFKQRFDLAVEQDICRIYENGIFRFSPSEVAELAHSVANLMPDLIIRDSVDIVGKQLAQLFSIKTVGYITHSLYTPHLFDSDPSKYYPHFTNTVDTGITFTADYYRGYWQKAHAHYQHFAKEYNTFPIDTYHQFNPREKTNLIFSPSFFQPTPLDPDYNYHTLSPPLAQFAVETAIEPALMDFVADEPVVLLSTGSMLNYEDEFYTRMIKALVKNGHKVVVSWKKDEAEQETLLQGIERERVFIRAFLPQKFVLTHAKLFICHGGFNSILEAIYYQVAFLVCPKTSEQSLNGLIVEELGIGLSTNIQREQYLTTGQMINSLLTNESYKKQLAVYHGQLHEADSTAQLQRIVQEITT